jgi:hypothetical protein
MTDEAVEFKTRTDLERERAALVRKSGLTLEELNSRAEEYRLSVEQYALYEAIADINYLLND